ncbi:EVE domain-containing protein [Phenylobacterium sp.]|uniref:EVE domain-containing protein n=1 Tax=Phenylobacterium sp. TaxID=1871053 RepID=UPI002734F53F|nr:EVE domain-containing protein [Phenylobacterium sp.]MDP3852886.1 EVE domain-containing protein [Phenylobacterium sp.]
MGSEARYWLVKSEPDTYSFDELVADGGAVWDGVRNNTAALNLRGMRVGDEVLFYHSGSGPAVVGLARVTREAFPDPGDASGRFVAVEIAPVKPLARPVTLSEIKARPDLAEMKIVRQSRLSVSPVTPTEWKTILGLGSVG